MTTKSKPVFEKNTSTNPQWKGITIWTFLRYLFLVVMSVITIYPIWWLITVSVKSNADYLAHPFALPEKIVLSNITGVLAQETMQRFWINSTFVTITSIVLVGVIGTMAGYALARYDFKMRDSILLIFLMSNMIPVTVLIIPLFVTLRIFHLLEGYGPMLVSYVALTLGTTVFLSRGFFRSITQDVLDAARLDGCNEWQSFFHVMMPLARSGLLLIIVLNFITIWNEFFLALVLVQDNAFYTLPLGLTVFRGRFNTDWPKLATAILLSTIPTILIYVGFQEKIIRSVGKSFSASKF